jgi:REP element-mobilizing transposase RayT
MHSIKSYFIITIRDQGENNFYFFQKRFHTRIISTHQYLETIIKYIKHNPIKDELPTKYHKPPYQYFIWEEIGKLF